MRRILFFFLVTHPSGISDCPSIHKLRVQFVPRNSLASPLSCYILLRFWDIFMTLIYYVNRGKIPLFTYYDINFSITWFILKDRSFHLIIFFENYFMWLCIQQRQSIKYDIILCLIICDWLFHYVFKMKTNQIFIHSSHIPQIIYWPNILSSTFQFIRSAKF